MPTTTAFLALRATRRPITVATFCLCQGLALAQSSLPAVEVVSTTLLPGLGTPMEDVPANVQLHNGVQLQDQQASSLSDYLELNASSVNLNAAQGNPFQPDVSFRGFTASPLLGLPQGLSVFQDGVRINEPFGDVVNWDLLPASAIAGMQLMPGSNPAFGLNTLGGALSVTTKSGLTHPGGAVQVQAGSFGRQAVEFEQGGKEGDWNYFLTGNSLRDSGWGEHNPSQVQQFFGKLGYISAQTTLDLSLTVADNTLEGSQTLPLSFSSNIRQAYTFPDQNRNQLGFLSLKGSHFLRDDLFLDGNVYYRRYQNQNISSNVNDNYDGVSDLVQATNDRSTIDQTSYGLGLQLTSLRTLAGKNNQLVVGANADFGYTRFTQEIQDAEFTANRGTRSTSDFTLDTHAKTSNSYYGIYFNNTLALDERWALTLSGRHNLASIRIADQTGLAPKLNGDHTFSRFNPAVGLNFKPMPRLTAYAAYNEGMRAPTPMELTCADPADPCKLPNSFLADPPLKMVVARTFEIGARGKMDSAMKWSAALYRTELEDDIQFISSGGLTNAGYFKNIGNTLRQGIELGLSQKWSSWGLSLRYGYLDATFQSAFTVHSPANSNASGGDIQVSPGNRIPGLPQHTLKLRLEHELNAQWNLGVNVLLSSGVYARGDENNQDAGGQVPGYAVVNIDSRYKASKQLEVFGRINNVFDQTYANFATLGHNYFPNYSFDTANPINEQFRGYGAPRGAWLGVRYRWQ